MSSATIRISRGKKNKTMKNKRKMTTSVVKLTKAVRQLQSSSANEKLRLKVNSTLTPFGQVLGNGDGTIIFDVTPIVGQGDQTAQRQGAQIKMHASHYQFMVGQQSATNFATKYKITWVALKGNSTLSTNITTYTNHIYTPNPFVTGADVRDYHATYNPDMFPNFKILRTVRKTMPADQINGILNTQTFSVGMKYNKGKGHNVRYNQNFTGADGSLSGQILMIIQADRGNCGGTNSTLGGIYGATANTGLDMQWARTDYYYDN